MARLASKACPRRASVGSELPARSEGSELLVESLLPAVTGATEVLGAPREERERSSATGDSSSMMTRRSSSLETSGSSVTSLHGVWVSTADRLGAGVTSCVSGAIAPVASVSGAGGGRPPDSADWEFFGSTLAWGLVRSVDAPVWAAGRGGDTSCAGDSGGKSDEAVPATIDE